MRFIYLSILLFISIFAVSQVYSEFDHKDSIPASENPPLFHQNKVKFSVEMGTTFGFSKGYGNYFGTYMSPQIQYPISKRFTASTGMIITGTTGGMVYSPFDSRFYNGGYSGSLVFVKGAYKVNENLTLTGATFHEINFNKPMPGNQPVQFQNSGNYKGLIMGADYKLGENLFIRGQVEFSNGHNPYRYSPGMLPAGHPFDDPFIH